MEDRFYLESEEHPFGYMAECDNILDGITMRQLLDDLKQEKKITPRMVSIVLYNILESRLDDLNSIVKENMPEILRRARCDTKVDVFTSDFEYEGYRYRTVDSTMYRGHEFFRMDRMEDGEEWPSIVVDKYGAIVAEDLWNGFDIDFEDAADCFLDENAYKPITPYMEEDY